MRIWITVRPGSIHSFAEVEDISHHGRGMGVVLREGSEYATEIT